MPPAWRAYQTDVFWLIPESLSGAHGKERRGIGAYALFTAVLVSRFSWNSSNLTFRMPLPCMILLGQEDQSKGLSATAAEDSLQMRIKVKLACTFKGDY